MNKRLVLLNPKLINKHKRIGTAPLIDVGALKNAVSMNNENEKNYEEVREICNDSSLVRIE